MSRRGWLRMLVKCFSNGKLQDGQKEKHVDRPLTWSEEILPCASATLDATTNTATAVAAENGDIVDVARMGTWRGFVLSTVRMCVALAGLPFNTPCHPPKKHYGNWWGGLPPAVAGSMMVEPVGAPLLALAVP